MDRSARWDRVGLSALCFDIFKCPLPALPNANIKALIDQIDLGPHDTAHQDVSDAVVYRVFKRNPALLNQTAFHADFSRYRSDLARMVGLHAANGDKSVGIRCNGVGHDVFEFSDLVPTKRQA